MIDGDGLAAIVGHFDTVAASDFPTVLTPHDGEYERLLGRRPGPDRIGAAAELADATEAVVVLKGPTTVVAEPGGRTLLAISGDSRLATAGTGDVLAGMIGALNEGRSNDEALIRIYFRYCARDGNADHGTGTGQRRLCPWRR